MKFKIERKLRNCKCAQRSFWIAGQYSFFFQSDYRLTRRREGEERLAKWNGLNSVDGQVEKEMLLRPLAGSRLENGRKTFSISGEGTVRQFVRGNDETEKCQKLEFVEKES